LYIIKRNIMINNRYTASTVISKVC